MNSYYYWNLLYGALPAGLIFTRSGNSITATISGTPTGPGPYSYAVSVNYLSGATLLSGEQAYSGTIGGGSLTLRCTPAAGPSQLGAKYSANCSASGGAVPYTWNIDAGAPPLGMELSSSGSTATVSGIPTAPGAYSYSVEVVDSTSPIPMTAPQAYSGTIVVESLGVTCTPATGPSQLGANYAATCSASGGIAPYAWSVMAGTLPTDLALHPNGSKATVSGIPTSLGPYSFAVQAADSEIPPRNARQPYSGNVGTLIPLPASLSFSSQAVGTTSSVQLITATNTSLSPITVSDVASTGDFAQTNNCGSGPVSPGASCAINVTFTPLVSGNRTGQVVITDDVPGTPQIVLLSGIGQFGPLSLSPLSLTLASETLGATSPAQSITATNTSSSPITITNIASTGDFAQTNNCESGLIGPSGTCTINATFTPSLAGNRTGQIIVTDDATGSPLTVALSGIGLGPLSLSPLSLTFPGQAVGTTSPAQALTATNTSSAP